MPSNVVLLIASLVAIPILYALLNVVARGWEVAMGRPYPLRHWFKPFMRLCLAVAIGTFAFSFL